MQDIPPAPTEAEAGPEPEPRIEPEPFELKPDDTGPSISFPARRDPRAMNGRAGQPEESLMGHLLELRARLLKAVVAVLVVFVALLPFANRLYGQFAAPLLSKLPAGGQLVAIDVASPFFTPVKLAFFAAVMLTMPVLLYQAWAFVAPGLYQHEKRLAKPLLAAAVVLFYTGCAFAWFLIAADGVRLPDGGDARGRGDDDRHHQVPGLRAGDLPGLRPEFQLPVAVVVLVLLGVVTPAQLREARGYVVVGVFVLAAIITPPDVVSQLLLAIPMCLLYELGIIAGALLRRRTADA
ncbi:twin-arginine translocase subunit TatC [Arenimonas daejeonensis]|uniref:twin-arginine translocase subunit TatC n=1 Tax=Arenimonas daejeonensis TaxID=370777 RepID=UPI002AD31B14|nr:twin-arginine translocase subunit TatC [Arenimonas daejeonensis]